MAQDRPHRNRAKKSGMSCQLRHRLKWSEADRLTIAGGVAGRADGGPPAAPWPNARRPCASAGGTRIAVLCGPRQQWRRRLCGGPCADRHGLRRRGLSRSAIPVNSRAMAAAYAQWSRDALPVETFVLDEADLVIDALFGAGLARDLDGETRMLVERVNAWRLARKGRCVVAVDVPSGVDGTTAQSAARRSRRNTTVNVLSTEARTSPCRGANAARSIAQIGIKAEVLRQIAPQTFWNVRNSGGLSSLPVPRTTRTNMHEVMRWSSRRPVLHGRGGAALRWRAAPLCAPA